MKRARSGIFNDSVSINIGEDCDIEINPTCNQASILHKFYDTHKERLDKIINLSGFIDPNVESSWVKNIAEIIADSTEHCVSTEIVRFYDLFACPVFFSLNDRTLYMACPDCMKKLNMDEDSE